MLYPKVANDIHVCICKLQAYVDMQERCAYHVLDKRSRLLVYKGSELLNLNKVFFQSVASGSITPL